MRQYNRFSDTRGWLSLWERTLRFRGMRDKQEVERRVRILSFWQEHGDAAAQDAFGVSRRTLYRWQAALEKEQGNLNALDPQSTAPKKKRSRRYPPGLTERIIALRTLHPRLGKEKLTPLLRDQEFRVSVSFTGRTLTDLKKAGRLPSPVRLSKRIPRLRG